MFDYNPTIHFYLLLLLRVKIIKSCFESTSFEPSTFILGIKWNPKTVVSRFPRNFVWCNFTLLCSDWLLVCSAFHMKFHLSHWVMKGKFQCYLNRSFAVSLLPISIHNSHSLHIATKNWIICLHWKIVGRRKRKSLGKNAIKNVAQQSPLSYYCWWGAKGKDHKFHSIVFFSSALMRKIQRFQVRLSIDLKIDQ